tara:strand:+ start:525 stop:1751 length:1227 start_codon:yes stop_codon:yes gene_type:complete
MWDTDGLTGPEGEDWRVPVAELEKRQKNLSISLSNNNIKSAWINDPVDLYWLAGNRQNGGLHISAEGEVTQYVRSSLERAKFESGGNDSPHEIKTHPRMANLKDEIGDSPALQLGRMTANDASFLQSKLGGEGEDCTAILWKLRETKSSWEIDQMKECGKIQKQMFEALNSTGMDAGEGITELELAAVADSVSRSAGFGGMVRMRKWPMDCDRVVIASGSSGAIPSYFDSAIGGSGANPLASLGAGHKKIRKGEPILVDIVHVHRGYITDMTRMFSIGKPEKIWIERLEQMEEIAKEVRNSLAKGDNCSKAWEIGYSISEGMGFENHLMGMPPEQSRFLGHSIGLELDETPVVASGFDSELHVGGTMAIEPKVIFPEGAVGIEDCWYRDENGLQCLSSGSSFPSWTEW